MGWRRSDRLGAPRRNFSLADLLQVRMRRETQSCVTRRLTGPVVHKSPSVHVAILCILAHRACFLLHAPPARPSAQGISGRSGAAASGSPRTARAPGLWPELYDSSPLARLTNHIAQSQAHAHASPGTVGPAWAKAGGQAGGLPAGLTLPLEGTPVTPRSRVEGWLAASPDPRLRP
jgi:hypothetical protein